jgi:CheY-like chemotaxis protein
MLDSAMREVSTPETCDPAAVQVLVIDDNAPDVMLISEALRDQGLTFNLTHLKDGEEAVSKLAQRSTDFHSYDLIVLDLNMPKVSGIEVLSSFRSIPELKKIPILVLTSSLAPDEQESVCRLGADRYLNKPADLYEFLAAVGSIVKELVPKVRARN